MRHAQKAVVYRLALLVDLLTFLVAPSLLCHSARALNPDRAISQYAHAAWRMQDGFFESNPTAVAQTTDGYLWFGTNSGLLRFDGVRFTPWTSPDGAILSRHQSIDSLLGARDGSLWIGIQGSLLHWKNQKLVRISITLAANALVEDRQGVVWFARGGVINPLGPICRVDNDKVRCLTKADGVSEGGGESLAQDAAGDLWVGTNRLLLKLRPGSSEVYKPNGLKSNNSVGIDALASSSDGSMWVGMAVPGRGLGLERLVNGTWMPFRSPQLDGSTLQVTDLLVDRDGALWIGTGDQGIYHFHNGQIDQFRRTDGLTSDLISYFFQDREGTVWVLTSRGVDSFHDLSVATWSARDGLTTDNVVSVAAGHDGTIWAGNAAGLDSIRNGKVSSIREGKGLPGNQVRSVFEDREDRLWVGVDNDLFLFQRGHFRKISRPDGTSIGPVHDITEDSQNNLWAETHGKFVCIHNYKVREEYQPPGVPSTNALAADTQGNLWLGLMSGDLARFRNGHAEIIHFPHATNSRVRQVVANPDGSILAATSFGVIAWRDGRTSTLGTRNGLPCDGINGLISDSSSNLWLHTACGLIEIDRSELQRWWTLPETTLQFRIFDAINGVQPGNAFYQPAARSKDGRLWFATGSVLQMVDPANLARNPIAPPVHVEEIVADRKHYSLQEVIMLPRLTRDVEIDYTALSFVAPLKVHFRYRLDGHDQDWQDSGTRRQAFYTGLDPGKYRFRVIACNNDGVWNESGAAVSFVIVPAFYQTSWFRTLCVLLAGSILFLFYLIHLKRVTNQMQEQLSTRLEERGRIARELHDTLLQGFQGLMLRFQAVLKSLPANAPAHQMMEQVLDRADEVLLEGRERVRDLRGEGVTEKDLPDSLKRCGKELTLDYPISFSLSVVGTAQGLDPTVFSEVYGIGREAITNAFRHSKASHIEVELTYHQNHLRLTICDNGQGIEQEILDSGRTGHWGLSGMRERAEKIGGRLNIWSHAGDGAEIDLIIPGQLAYPRQRPTSRWDKAKRAVSGIGGAST